MLNIHITDGTVDFVDVDGVPVQACVRVYRSNVPTESVMYTVAAGIEHTAVAVSEKVNAENLLERIHRIASAFVVKYGKTPDTDALAVASALDTAEARLRRMAGSRKEAGDA